jgi:hypothetical protein
MLKSAGLERAVILSGANSARFQDFTILCPTILPHSYHYAVNVWRFFRCHRCRYCGGASPTSAGFSTGRVCLGISQGFVKAAPTDMSEIVSRNIRVA